MTQSESPARLSWRYHLSFQRWAHQRVNLTNHIAAQTSAANQPPVLLAEFVALSGVPSINQFAIVADNAITFGSCFRIDDR